MSEEKIVWDETPTEWKQKYEEKRHAEICELAYKKWQDAGEPHGDGTDFWLEAENEWEKTRLLDERWQPIGEDECCHSHACCGEVQEDSEDTTHKVTKEELTLLNRFCKWLGGS
jgi:uncharacterized protein YdaU (DUF1376 family)